MEAKTVNTKKSVELNELVWNAEFNTDLVAQAIYVYQSNQRSGSANVKTRAEVAGGGRKPWKQKKTGRARQGSIRSPLWYKGGVTFGPSSDRNWTRKINKKMNRKAIASVLSEMLRNDAVKFYDVEGETKKDKRNSVLNVVGNLKNVSLVCKDNELALATRNLEEVRIVRADQINVFDLARANMLVIETDTVKMLEGIVLNG